MKATLLIDADEYVHVACAAVEYEARWDDENVILASNVKQAWDTFESMIQVVKDGIGGDLMLLFAFTAPMNFRKAVYPPYKAKRGGRKPLCFSDLKNKVNDTYRCFTFNGLEADDVLGILATGGYYENPIIISQDKDMLTLPTSVWREGKVQTITPAFADFNWLKQTLTGDTSDGYPGCPGVGPVTAEKLLDNFIVHNLDGTTSFELAEAWKAVVQQFVKKGLSEDDALTQAQCARILRASDWDDVEGVKLWAP
jgi:DNA polymerase-1